MYSLGIVAEAFLGIILTLDSWIYSLVSGAYKVFMAIASARLLSSDAYTEIANKVYIIIGVGMLFVLAYSILKAIIDPDQLSKGDMAGGKILKSVAYAVIGLIVTPLLFNVAYKVQNQMLEEDILGKLFFRTSDSVVSVEGVGNVNYDEMIKHTGGAVAATSVWQAFFYPADGVDPNEIYADAEIVRQTANLAAAGCAASVGVAAVGIIAGFFTAGVAWVVSGAAVLSCVNAVIQDGNADKVEEAVGDLGKFSLTQAYAMVSGGESFAIFQAFLEPVDEGEIKYVWFISTVFGAFVAYAFVTYAIDMGTRAAKLAYFQIIAPVPLILQILPKSGDKLNKFIKGIFSTFLEVFVRISIVYIIVYIVCHLNEVFSTVSSLWNSSDLSGFEILLAKALLIIGLVIFAKQAPKIISDTFGLSAGGALDGLNLMKKLRDGEVFTAGHMVGSAGLSAVQGFRSNFNRKEAKDLFGNKKQRNLASRVVGGVGTAIGGAVSGGVRAGYGRYKSGKPVANPHDAGDAIVRTSDAVSTSRDKRVGDWEDRDGIVDYVKYKVGRTVSKIDTLTDPDAKEVRADKTIKAFGSTVDQQDAYRAKTGKAEGTRYADRLVDNISKEGAPQEYYEDAYRAALNAATQSVIRRPGESDADYQSRVNAATSAVNREDFKNTRYAIDMSDYQRRTNAANKAREAMQDLDYIGLLTSDDAATIAHFKKYFAENISEIKAHQSDILKDKRGNVIEIRNAAGDIVGSTYGDLLRVNYGLNLDTGEVDLNSIKNAPRNFVIEVEDPTTGNRSEITYDVQYNNGQQRFTDQHGNVFTYQQVLDRATEKDVTGVKAKTVINSVTDTVKDARNEILGSESYNRAKARQRQKQENKTGK